MHITHRFSDGKAMSVRERRCVYLNMRESEEAVDRANAPKGQGPLTAENNARMLAEKMADRLGKIGVMTKLNHWLSGKRAEHARVDSMLDAAAQKEIASMTDATVSWIGGFVKRRKYREYIALRYAVKERLRGEVQTYVAARHERLKKLEFAASVSARLKGMKTFLPFDKSAEAKVEAALQRVQASMDKARLKDEAKGRTVPQEWMEGAEAEAALKKQLIRFNVSPAHQVEDYLRRHADGGRELIEAIRRNAFIDPDDALKSGHTYEKELCLRTAKSLQGGWFSKPYRGYRNFRLTQKSGNELPFEKRLAFLADGDPVAKRVQCAVDGIGKVDLTVVARDAESPRALVLQGSGGERYVLDAETGRLSFKDRTRYRHVLLNDRTFSILS